ncbi:MAG: SDR family oxidoreductase [Archangiaceae bacterium]|nr:SDR family oxidoreductase [Archangiaceae bacterium]
MKDLHVVVTGAYGALGTAVRAVFEAEGAVLHTPAAELVDLADEGAVSKYYQSLPELWASVHLAGGFAAAPFLDTTLDDVHRQLDMNFVTALLCCREAVKKRAQRLVNVASRAALVPSGGSIAYAASKAAVVMLTQSLAEELKPRQVLVNAVAPSVMDTPANRKAMPDADFSRWPSTQNVARAILWLASPQNVLTSGAVVPVYGQA